MLEFSPQMLEKEKERVSSFDGGPPRVLLPRTSEWRSILRPDNLFTLGEAIIFFQGEIARKGPSQEERKEERKKERRKEEGREEKKTDNTYPELGTSCDLYQLLTG